MDYEIVNMVEEYVRHRYAGVKNLKIDKVAPRTGVSVSVDFSYTDVYGDHIRNEYTIGVWSMLAYVNSKLEGNKMSKKLEWPISEDMIGKKVVFKGFTNPDYTHWDFTEGYVYVISKSGKYIGPLDEDGDVAAVNWGFDFELVDEEIK